MRKTSYFSYCTFWSTSQSGSTTTDREPTDRKQTDHEQRRLAEKGYPEFIFTIPRVILPKLSLCDKITVTKSLLHNQVVAVSWLGSAKATLLLLQYRIAIKLLSMNSLFLIINIQSFIHTVQQSANFGILKRSANMYSSVLVRTA